MSGVWRFGRERISMRTMLCSTILATAALLLAPLHAAAITFDDGMVHVIDAANSYPFV